MKFVFKPSPNYRTERSTIGIMRDLTICLCAVVLFSAVYHGTAFGFSYGLRVVLMSAVSVIAALATEAVYFKIMGSKDIVKDLRHSFGWVTALILTLITRLDVTYYALAVATAICIVFGKLVFGGFGQNIFNPAAFGEAIIMNSFAAHKAAQVTADVYTGATPMAAMDSYGWIMSSDKFGEFVQQFGGLGNMFLGQYPSVIGGSCAALLLLCGAYMLWKKDIDWHLSVFYLISVFCMSLIVGLIKGAGIWYAVFNILGGGVLFGAVFMMTDPVTTPITIPGRMIFAFGCAALTLILRCKSNLPDGVLFSILLMNMLTPAIDKLVDGNQIKNAGIIRRKVIISSAFAVAVCMAVGLTIEGKEPAPAAPAGGSAEVTPLGALQEEDLSSAKAACTESSNDGKTAIYACEAFGFEGTNKADVTVDLKKNEIVSVKVTEFNDTEGIGDAAVTEEALKAYKGVTLEGNVDDASAATPATMTKKALRAMVQKALLMATGQEAAAPAKPPLSEEKLKGYHGECTAESTDGDITVYACKATGFSGGTNEAKVTVDTAKGTVTDIEITVFADDGDDVGDDAADADKLERYIGASLDSSIDNLSGATKTTGSFKAMVRAALEAAGADEIPEGGSAASAGTIGNEAFSLSQKCTESSNDGSTAVYACSAKGYAGTNEAEITVDLKEGKITAMEITTFADDGDNVGDDLNSAEKLGAYVGATLQSAINETGGATMTADSFKAMAAEALKAAAGN